MLYLTKEAGAAIGAMISAVDAGSVTVRLEQDSMVITFASEKTRSADRVKPAKPPAKQSPAKKSKSSSRRQQGKIKFVRCGDETLSLNGWANKLGVTKNAIQYRVKHHGSPYGAQKPGDSDKIIAG